MLESPSKSWPKRCIKGRNLQLSWKKDLNHDLHINQLEINWIITANKNFVRLDSSFSFSSRYFYVESKQNIFVVKCRPNETLTTSFSSPCWHKSSRQVGLHFQCAEVWPPNCVQTLSFTGSSSFTKRMSLWIEEFPTSTKMDPLK